MKRLGSCDSFGNLMSISPTPDENQFQSMLDGLDEEGCVEEPVHVIGEKKRRLGVAQVKALEKNFEVENKLEPDRKVKLAQELGLQPRQVAVWFQNRRARWKTKQLERDYGLLKSNYEALKTNYDALRHDNEALLKEIEKLKSKLNEDNTESNISVKEEAIPPDSDDDVKVSYHPQQQPQSQSLLTASETKDLLMNYDNDGVLLSGASLFPDFKDGSSDSDSSAVLNDVETTTTNSCFILSPPGGTTTGSSSSNIAFKFNVNVNPSTINNNGFKFSASSTTSSTTSGYQALQLVKMEEHNFFSGEEACNFFSDEQPPTLQWYCPDQWNYET